jgi:glyoxylate/hydroxypyruvate reductase A
MGMGVLGRAVLESLASLGFERSAWSRSPRSVPGVACHAGAPGLQDFLEHCDILVCLLPLTRETRGILNAELFAALPRGAALVNAARGAHLETQALIDALDSGQVSAAVLDVTEPEPLPSNHPFWRHPRIVLTPHIASATEPTRFAMTRVLVDNLAAAAAGRPLVTPVTP